MEWIHALELPLIRLLQSVPEFEMPARTLSKVGLESLVYIEAAVLLLVSRSAGLHLLILHATGWALVPLLKLAFRQPRPYWIDAQIVAMDPSDTFGLPSGHALMAALILLETPRRLKWYGIQWLFLVAALGVSLSRVYLGAHFYTDILAAWMVAVVILRVSEQSEPGWGRVFESASAVNQLAWSCAGLGTLVTVAIFLGSGNRMISYETEWVDLALQARSLANLPSVSLEWAGLAVALAVAGRFVNFAEGIPDVARVLGAACVLAGWWAIQRTALLVPEVGVPGILTLRGAELAQFAKPVWLVIVAPWLLLQLKILKPLPPPVATPQGRLRP